MTANKIAEKLRELLAEATAEGVEISTVTPGASGLWGDQFRVTDQSGQTFKVEVTKES